MNGTNASGGAFFPVGHTGRRVQVGESPFTSTFKGKISSCGKFSVLGFRVLYRVWHRTHSPCTADEAWTRLVTFGYRFPFRVYCLIPTRYLPLDRYLLLNRNGTASQVESASRNFNPVVIFNELKYILISITKLILRAFPQTPKQFVTI